MPKPGYIPKPENLPTWNPEDERKSIPHFGEPQRLIPKPENLPQWVKEELHEAHKTHPKEQFAEDETFQGRVHYSRVVAICYPNQRHWEVEGLKDGTWWADHKHYHSEELALAAARRMAYSDQTPYRVKEVIWNG